MRRSTSTEMDRLRSSTKPAERDYTMSLLEQDDRSTEAMLRGMRSVKPLPPRPKPIRR
jgi:hypothetical protein